MSEESKADKAIKERVYMEELRKRAQEDPDLYGLLYLQKLQEQ